MNMYKQVDNHVELCISPSFEKEIRKLFDKEIESGYKTVLKDGRIFFSFTIHPEKYSLLHQLSEWVNCIRLSDERHNRFIWEIKECVKHNNPE